MKTKSKFDISSVLKNLKLTGTQSGASTGLDWLKTSGDILESSSPIDEKVIVPSSRLRQKITIK